MTTRFTEVARRAAEDGQVTVEELLEMRREGWGDGIITREEAEAIFTVNNVLTGTHEEWVDFFVEAITEYVLNGTEPKRQCDDQEAKWLIDQVQHDGKVESMAELELLVRVIERAENVPDALKDFVLETIEREVLTGVGPTRHGGDLSARHISAAECRILRRVIFASGGHGAAAVSRKDAEMLFRLKDETLEDENALVWEDLFVDGVTNYLQGFSLGNAQLSHGRRKELEAFVADNKANVGRFMGGMLREAPNVANHFGKVFGKKQQSGADYDAMASAAEMVTENENAWLQEMVDADGQLDELERRVIKRLESEVG